MICYAKPVAITTSRLTGNSVIWQSKFGTFCGKFVSLWGAWPPDPALGLRPWTPLGGFRPTDPLGFAPPRDKFLATPLPGRAAGGRVFERRRGTALSVHSVDALLPRFVKRRGGMRRWRFKGHCARTCSLGRFV